MIGLRLGSVFSLVKMWQKKNEMKKQGLRFD